MRRRSSSAYKARAAVVRGTKKTTAGGLRPQDLWYSHHTGKLVSIRRSQLAVALYPSSKLRFWNECVAEARIICDCQHRFVPVGGKTMQGRQLHETALAIKRMRGDFAPRSPSP